MYIRIVSAAAIQTGVIIRNVKHFQPDMPEHITRPLRRKKFMFIILTVSLALAMLGEAITQGIVATGGQIQAILFVYELSNLACTFMIGAIFHPTEYSPFFFMEPISDGDGDALIVGTLVKPVEDRSVAPDIEIASLIGSRMIDSLWQNPLDPEAPSTRMTELLRSPRNRLIVVESPKDRIALGISDSDGPSSSLVPMMVEGSGQTQGGAQPTQPSQRGGRNTMNSTATAVYILQHAATWY